MGRACSTNGERMNAYRILVEKPKRKRNQLNLFFYPEDGRRYVSPKHRLTLNGLQALFPRILHSSQPPM
jgi:hypothetical protein